MNREIKFRAWDLNDNIMIYQEESFLLHHLLVWSSKNASILMQYTGLKDKNGKEIYEGDIVRCNIAKFEVRFGFHLWHDPDGCEQESLGFYGLWEDKSGHRRFDSDEKDLEVLGNIYKNPELLENQDD